MATRKSGTRKKASNRARSGSAKKAKKKGTWGGARPGAGRPLGSGTGPSPDSRSNRVAVMFSDTELRTLKKIARSQGQPVSTAAHAIVERRLRRKA